MDLKTVRNCPKTYNVKGNNVMAHDGHGMFPNGCRDVLVSEIQHKSFVTLVLVVLNSRTLNRTSSVRGQLPKVSVRH